eukprot:3703182-Alexandrium_andersonii.AAC.1
MAVGARTSNNGYDSATRKGKAPQTEGNARGNGAGDTNRANEPTNATAKRKATPGSGAQSG